MALSALYTTGPQCFAQNSLKIFAGAIFAANLQYLQNFGDKIPQILACLQRKQLRALKLRQDIFELRKK